MSLLLDVHKLNYNINNIKFCFITSSYNQEQFIIMNLNSIRIQKYNNYRVLYVNDNSTDNSLNILQRYRKSFPSFKMKIINNNIRRGPAYSRQLAYNKCADDEICVFLDGDDFLLNPYVLNILATVYSLNSEILATFGSAINIIKNYKNTNYSRQNTDKYYSHLRTARAKYVKKIPQSYLKDSYNNWFMFCTDVALFTALVEIIGNRYAFIKNNIIYYNKYNTKNNNNEGYENQNNSGANIRIRYHKHINSITPLKPVLQLPKFDLNKYIQTKNIIVNKYISFKIV